MGGLNDGEERLGSGDSTSEVGGSNCCTGEIDSCLARGGGDAGGPSDSRFSLGMTSRRKLAGGRNEGDGGALDISPSLLYDGLSLGRGGYATVGLYTQG